MIVRTSRTDDVLAEPIHGADVISLRLRGLALFDPTELSGSSGFGWVVRALVAGPLTSIGLLACLAALAMGDVLVASMSATLTGLIIHALRHDTRFAMALEQLRRGELKAAEMGLRMVAMGSDHPEPQRQRARGYLVAIAWARGDHRTAFEWVRAHNEGDALRHMDGDDRYASVATEIQLLALLGRREEAARALRALPSAPSGKSGCRTEAMTRLLVAFAVDDAQSVKADLDAWAAELTGDDDPGLVTGLVAWCRDALGRREDAHWLVERVRRRAGAAAFVRTHVPRLWQWVETFEGGTGRHYG